MIRVFEKDKEKLLEYLSLEPYFNIYIFGDLELFGLSSDTVKIFVDNEDEISCAVMEYAGDYVVYSHKNNFDAKVVAEHIKGGTEYHDACISGKGSTVQLLAKYLPEKTLRRTMLACFEGDVPSLCAEVERLGEGDAQGLLGLYLEIEEFAAKYRAGGEQRVARELKNGRTFAIRGDAGELVAAASSTAESATGAMITNVCTHPLHRRKGLAEKIIRTLIASIKGEEIESVCLYYDNPDAAKLYKKLGFADKGEYMTLR